MRQMFPLSLLLVATVLTACRTHQPPPAAPIVAGPADLPVADFVAISDAIDAHDFQTQWTYVSAADGRLGEGNDGLIHERGTGLDGKMRDDMATLNFGRSRVYADVASQTGHSPETVGQVQAARLRTAAPPGIWLQSPDGRWSQKQAQ